MYLTRSSKDTLQVDIRHVRHELARETLELVEIEFSGLISIVLLERLDVRHLLEVVLKDGLAHTCVHLDNGRRAIDMRAANLQCRKWREADLTLVRVLRDGREVSALVDHAHIHLEDDPAAALCILEGHLPIVCRTHEPDM